MLGLRRSRYGFLSTLWNLCIGLRLLSHSHLIIANFYQQQYSNVKILSLTRSRLHAIAPNQKGSATYQNRFSFPNNYKVGAAGVACPEISPQHAFSPICAFQKHQKNNILHFYGSNSVWSKGLEQSLLIFLRVEL